MSWNSGGMGEFTGPTVAEAEEAERLQEEKEEAEIAALNSVYRERNRMVAHFAAEYPSKFVPGADPQWPSFAVVYVNLPTGQVSWHVGPRDFDLFGFMEPSHPDSVKWDGHDTDEKYRRVDQNARNVYVARMATGVVGSPQVPGPNGDPIVEIDEDFYIYGGKIMCRLEHFNDSNAILGEATGTEDEINVMLMKHDEKYHNGPSA